MKEKQFEKLLPFLHRKAPRQRVILYLLADGFSASALLAMKVIELRALKLPVAMHIYRDEMLYGSKAGLAFVYPTGNPMRVTDCKRLVREAAEKVLGDPLSLEAFRIYIQTGKRSNS